MLESIKKTFQKLALIYMGVPRKTKAVFPMVILEHLAASFCLNISIYFKKIDHMHYDLIGEFLSFYYWGCLIGALLGGVLTLKYRTTKISGLGLLILSICLYFLITSID